jgi:hypothetical protein
MEGVTATVRLPALIADQENRNRKKCCLLPALQLNPQPERTGVGVEL